MGVDLGALDIRMAGKFPYRPDVFPVFQRVGGKAMRKREEPGIGLKFRHIFLVTFHNLFYNIAIRGKNPEKTKIQGFRSEVLPHLICNILVLRSGPG
jgi:hypothetical protein